MKPSRPVPADAHSVPQRQRLDKYLWFARVVKSRTLAAKLVADGGVRVNSQRIVDPSKAISPGDVLTIALHRNVRVLKVLAPGLRRGPYEEARLLYEEIPETPAGVVPGAGDESPDGAAEPAWAGPVVTVERRPEKRQRRLAATLKRQSGNG